MKFTQQQASHLFAIIVCSAERNTTLAYGFQSKIDCEPFSEGTTENQN